METIERQVVAGGSWGEINRQSTEDFQGSEDALHDIIMMDTYYFIFVKTRRMQDPNREPSGKLWALVNCDVSVQVHPWPKKEKWTIRVSDVMDNGGGCVCMGAGVIWEICKKK